MRRSYVTLAAGLALFLVACGGDAGPGAEGASSSGGTTKKLPGSVCSLLTAAEVASTTRVTQTLTPVEGGGGSDDRTCNYTITGGASVLAVTLGGELEPVEWDGVKAVPGAVTVNVTGGAEARYIPMTNILYVHKNGLQAALLLVIGVQGETPQVTVSKFAQPVASKLP